MAIFVNIFSWFFQHFSHNSTIPWMNVGYLHVSCRQKEQKRQTSYSVRTSPPRRMECMCVNEFCDVLCGLVVTKETLCPWSASKRVAWRQQVLVLQQDVSWSVHVTQASVSMVLHRSTARSRCYSKVHPWTNANLPWLQVSLKPVVRNAASMRRLTHPLLYLFHC